MSSPKYLFLHLGPGGNSAHERATLQALEDKIEFWDQPILRGADCTYEKLVEACAKKFDSQEYAGVIGHSFGCDIAQSLVGRTTRPIQHLILVSPIRDLPTGFAHLAEKLGVAAEAVKKLRDIIESRVGQNSSPDELGAFWQMAQGILTTPRFYRTYWASEKNLVAYESLAARLPPLDAEMWQTGLTDFLLKREKLREPRCERTVVLGDHDPYHFSFLKEQSYWEGLGFKVHVIKNAGHYPHIEGGGLNFLSR